MLEFVYSFRELLYDKHGGRQEGIALEQQLRAYILYVWEYVCVCVCACLCVEARG